MILAALLATTALAAPAQFHEGSAVTSTGCFDIITGTETPSVVLADAGVFLDSAHQAPKQGDTFIVYINVFSFSQPCSGALVARPGIKLPPGVELVPHTSFSSPIPHCFMGPQLGNLSPVGCVTQPTAQLADGTLLFDAPNGFWHIPDGQQLQIQIPVRGHIAETTNLQGYVDFTSFDGFRLPLQPTVSMQVFFNPPAISFPSPAVTDIAPYSAHVFGFVDPHFNAGTVSLEMAPAGQPLAVVDQAQLDASQFEADVDLAVSNLLPDTDYVFRWSYAVDGVAQAFDGPTQTFHTLPPPRFAFTSSVEGNGTIVANPPPAADGTYADRTSVTFTVSPGQDSRLVSFTVNGQAVSGVAATVTVSGAVDVHAVFEDVPPPPPAASGEGEGEGEGAPAPAAGDDGSTTTTDPGAGDPGAATGDPAPAAGSDDASATAPAQGPAADGQIHVDTPASDDAAAHDAGSENDAAGGGCGATKPAAVPAGFLLLVLWRRRRR